jgi:hypothetical protein
MAVLSNNGRLISSLPATSIISATDEFLIQSNGITKRTSYAALTSSILSAASFNPFINQVRFTNTNNKFTGSFYNSPSNISNFNTVKIRSGLVITGSTFAQTITANKFSGSISGFMYGKATGSFKGGFTGSLSGSVKGRLTGSFTGSVKGTLNGNVTSTGTSTFSKITAARITSSVGIVGKLTGSIRGDVYNESSVKVLENGSGAATPNGGIPNAYFYGTSSFAVHATLADSALTSVATNGIPTGGVQYQILAKNSGTNYDVIWTNPITGSQGLVGVANYLTIWDGARSIKNVNSFYYNTTNYVTELPLRSKNGFYINSGEGAFTGSSRVNEDLKTITTPGQTRTLNGDKFGSIKLELSASGNITMSLKTGQTCTVFIESNGSGNTVTSWSGLSDSGAVSIYWKNGSVPTVSSGAGKKDVFTFVNIKERIFASAIQNFS